jgi:hypothetical protein
MQGKAAVKDRRNLIGRTILSLWFVAEDFVYLETVALIYTVGRSHPARDLRHGSLAVAEISNLKINIVFLYVPSSSLS